MPPPSHSSRVDKEKIIITHYSEEIGDMTTSVVYWRANALTYAKDKLWVTIRVVE